MRSKDDPSTNTRRLGDGDDSEGSMVDTLAREAETSYSIMFDVHDGDVELQIGQALFRTRKCLLNKFIALKGLIQEAESSSRSSSRGATPLVVLKCDKRIAEDFNDTFKILYASVIEGPFEFDSNTLMSALRTATTYDYPALRTFSIQGLERAGLTPVQRIKIARELDVQSWMEPACEELCNRQEPITQEEARIMGIDTLLRVSNMREQRRTNIAQADQPNNPDVRTNKQKSKTRTGTAFRAPRAHRSQVVLEEGMSEGSDDSTRDAGSEEASSGAGALVECGDDLPELDHTCLDTAPRAGQPETEENRLYANTTGADEYNPDDEIKRCFIGACIPSIRVHVPKLSSRRRLEVAIPECICIDPAVSNGTCTSECRIPPCLFKVLRSLQTEHAALAAEVMVLQTVIPGQG